MLLARELSQLDSYPYTIHHFTFILFLPTNSLLFPLSWKYGSRYATRAGLYLQGLSTVWTYVRLVPYPIVSASIPNGAGT